MNGKQTCEGLEQRNIALGQMTVESKILQVALQESERKYRLLVENAADIIYRTSALGRFLYLNPAAEKLIGHKQMDLIGRRCGEIVRADYRIRALRFYGRQIAKKIPQTYFELPLLLQDRGDVWIGQHVQLIINYGQVTGLQAIARDITERKRMEEALRKSEESLQRINEQQRFAMEISHLGVWDLNLVDHSAFRSLKHDRIFGYKEHLADWTYEMFLEHVLPEDRAMVDRLYRQAMENRSDWNFQCRIRRVDGEVRWIWAAGRHQIDGTGIAHRMAGIVQDITERKQTEESLREAQMKYGMLHQGMRDAFVSVDMDGHIKDYNESYLSMLGYSPEELKTLSYKDITPGKWHKIEQRIVEEQVIPKGYSDIYEKEYRKKDGTIIPVELRTSLIRDASGSPTLMWAIIRDITIRKAMEKERQQWEQYRQQLHKAESLSRMAGAIAHHFNNRLVGVIGNLEMALMKLPKGMAAIDFLNAAMEEAWKAAEMSALMLTYIGQSHDKLDPLDLSEICRRSLPILKAALPGNVCVKTELPYSGPIIKANVKQIQHVLNNLVTNAREAVGEGGGAIYLNIKTVSQAAIPLAHRFPINWQPKDDGYACLEVIDTGCGIEDEDIEKLFDPFYSSKFTGRGLGLAIVVGIVREHNGLITVESEPGRGSTFRVFFPISAE